LSKIWSNSGCAAPEHHCGGARTIADLEGGAGCVEKAQLAEALQYRRG
jgi:magnesium chelatase family protein